MNRCIPMRKTLVSAILFLFAAIPASAQLDVVSGASRGRNMVTVSAITTTETSAALTYSEGYRNGTFRFYYTTTAFASSSDSNRATVTKMNVSSRGSGTLNVSKLAANTKYFFRFQGYYPTGMANYWATGSFTTKAVADIVGSTPRGMPTGSATVDALGRAGTKAVGVGLGPEGATARPQR
jgi:hypothetical protein